MKAHRRYQKGAMAVVLALVFSGCAAKRKPLYPPPSSPALAPETPNADSPSEDERRRKMSEEIARLFLPIYFEYDRFSLSPQARSVLGGVGDLMKEYPEITLTVEGHTDDRGTEAYNLALGEKRARSALEYLKNIGVPETRVSLTSFGEEKSAASGDDESAWSKNRRDEFKAVF